MENKVEMKWQSNEEMICYCQNVSKKEIVAAIENGASSLADVQRITGAGTGSRCKELNPKGVCCHRDILDLLNNFNKKANGNEENVKCCCCDQD
jgi:NAD(P)H-nitrite reductase large subunit